MKKLIAIAVVFVLVTGAVFADLGFGGELSYQVNVAQGDSDHDEIMAGTNNVGSRLDARFGDDNFGGMLRFLAAGTAVPGHWGGNPKHFGFVWWKPVEQFKIQVGSNPDGDWGVGSTGWGFLAQAQDFVALDKWSGYGSYSQATRGEGMYPGFSQPGVLFSIYPVEDVAINFALPFPQGSTTELYKVLGHLDANVAFKIGDIGNALVAFVGGNGMYDDNKESAGALYAYFNLTAVENLGLDLGIKFPLPFKNATDTTTAPGMDIGLGASYSAGDFGVKFRAGVLLPTSVDNEVADGTLTKLGFGILPYIGLLDGKMTAYLNAGLGMGVPKGDGDTNVDWYVNPYIKVPVGGLSFYAGFKLKGETNKPGDDKATEWALPIGFLVYF